MSRVLRGLRWWLPLARVSAMLHSVDAEHPIVRVTRRRISRTQDGLRKWSWLLMFAVLFVLVLVWLSLTPASPARMNVGCIGALLLLLGPVLLARITKGLLWAWDGAGAVAQAAQDGRFGLLALLPEGPTVAALRVVYGALGWMDEEQAEARATQVLWRQGVGTVAWGTLLGTLLLALMVGYAMRDVVGTFLALFILVGVVGVLALAYWLELTHSTLLALLAALVGPTLARSVIGARTAAVTVYVGAQLTGYSAFVWMAIQLGVWLRPGQSSQAMVPFVVLLVAAFYAVREVWVLLLWWLVQRRWGEALAPAHRIPLA